MLRCEAAEEATAPVFCCPGLGVAEEENGGAGTPEVVSGRRLFSDSTATHYTL